MKEQKNMSDAERRIQELIRQIKGPVFLPNNERFIEEEAGFQTAFRNHPNLIIGAMNAEDVQVAVNYASEKKMPIAVQATGHGRPRTEKGGLLVTTKRMTRVHVDPSSRTVEMEAGVSWEQVIQQAAPYGLAPLSGSSPSVGAISYTIGGGLGILGRQYGYAADHVHWIEVVTADGNVQTVNAKSNPDLFWALRGAGTNFGIITKLKMDLVPLPRLYGGGLYFDAESVPNVLNKFIGWTRTVPEELTSSISLLKYPDMAVFPASLRGRYVAHVRVAYSGDACNGEQLIAPIRAIGPRLIDTVKDMPYTDSGSIYSDPPMPHAYCGSNLVLKDLDASVLQNVVDSTKPNSSPTVCIVDVRHLGGALTRQSAIPNSVGHRNVEYLVRMLSPIGAAGLPPVVSAHKHFFDSIGHLAIGRRLNFIYAETSTSDHVQASFNAEDYQRLRHLKKLYDPNNLFRLNYNILPA